MRGSKSEFNGIKIWNQTLDSHQKTWLILWKNRKVKMDDKQKQDNSTTTVEVTEIT